MPETAADDVILDHLWLASRLASRYEGRGVDRDDLLQVARLALVKAARTYEPARGPFVSYATVTVNGHLKRHFRDHAWGVRPPRWIQEIQAALGSGDFGDWDSIDVEAAAGQLGVESCQVREAVGARGCFHPDSLEPADAGSIDAGLERVDEWVTFCELCKDLTFEERRLLHWRFVEEQTQQQMADGLGISQMQVSRRLSRLLGELRRSAA